MLNHYPKEYNMDLKDITTQLAVLTEKIETLLQKPREDAYSSPELKDLYAALAKAQGEYPTISPNRENPYFKSAYTDLDGVLRVIRPVLSRNGLGFMQQLRINEEGMTILHSILSHASGQWMESRQRVLPPKNDAQTLGSTLSYLKRYAAMSLLGITISLDIADDDAEAAMVQNKEMFAKGTSINHGYNAKQQSYEPITKEQLEELEYELEGNEDIAEKVLDGLQIQSLCDMPKTKFLVSINRIREIKRTRDNT